MPELVIHRLMREAGCALDHRLHWHFDVGRWEEVFQHGDNPEAVLRLPHFMARVSQRDRERRVCDWLRDVHRYEAGR